MAKKPEKKTEKTKTTLENNVDLLAKDVGRRQGEIVRAQQELGPLVRRLFIYRERLSRQQGAEATLSDASEEVPLTEAGIEEIVAAAHEIDAPSKTQLR